MAKPHQSLEKATLFRSAEKICRVLADIPLWVVNVARAVGSSLMDKAASRAKLAAVPPLKITPPCGRGLRNSSGNLFWCELRNVNGVSTCLACGCIAPGNITEPSSW
jgi:hypothetical protein